MDLKQFDIFLHDAEVKLKRLKALYEQWFQGLERLEPTVPRKDFDRDMVLLIKERPRNTAARFKLQQLKARYNTYTVHWQRISRQIEEGTYARDLKRAKQRRPGVADGPEGREAAKSYELDIDSAELFAEDELSSVLQALDKGPPQAPAAPRRAFSAFSSFSAGAASTDLPAEDTQPNAVNPFATRGVVASFSKPTAPATPASPAKYPTPTEPLRPSGSRPKPPPVPAAARRPPAPPPSKSPMERLYEDYVAARRRNNEPVNNVRIDKLTQSVAQMREKLGAKHAGKTIDFEVVVQNGRVGLKPKIE